MIEDISRFRLRGETVLGFTRRHFERVFPEGQLFAYEYFVDHAAIKPNHAVTEVMVRGKSVDNTPLTLLRPSTFKFKPYTDEAVLLLLLHKNHVAEIHESAWVVGKGFRNDEVARDAIITAATHNGFDVAPITTFVTVPRIDDAVAPPMDSALTRFKNWW